MGTYESACTLHRNESFLRKLVSEKWVNGNSIISKVYMIFICTYVLFQLHVFITNESLLTHPFFITASADQIENQIQRHKCCAVNSF